MDARGMAAQLGKTDGCSIGQEGWLLNWERGTVAQLGKRNGWMQEGRLLNWARRTVAQLGKTDGCSIGQEGWLLNWERGTVAQLGKTDGCSIGQEERMDARGTVAQLGKRDADDGWMQDGRLLNWVRGMRMADGCKTDGCLIGKRDMDDGWMDAQLGGGTLPWEERMLNRVEGRFCGREGRWIRIFNDVS